MSENLLTVCERLYFKLHLRLKESTRYQYRHALADWAQYLGREPTVADLTDDSVTLWMADGLARGKSAVYVREMAGRVSALWTWMAKRDRTMAFPSFAKPDAPDALPTALSEHELRRLFESAGRERGRICDIPAGLWWTSFLAFVWNTAERKTAALACQVAWIDLATGTVSIPPQFRKGGKKWGIYRLWTETLKLVVQCLEAQPGREQIWPQDFCHESYYTRYNRILRDAGIPVDRRHKTHSLRCSHATWLSVKGGDPTQQLGHGDPNTTRRYYLDPKFTTRDQPKLFIPWQNVAEGG